MPRPVLLNLLLAAAYFLAAKPATLLAIPPSHAAPIWPAAGIALGVALVFGYRVIPGAMLGAFLAALGEGFATPLPALCTALGVGLQTTFALALCRWANLHQSPLDSGLAIIKLFLLGGAVSGLVHALTAAVTLRIFGASPEDQIFPTFLTTWAAHFSGILIFTPLTLIVAGRPRELWHSRLGPVGVPLFIAFALSIFLFIFTSRWEQERRRAFFEARAASHQSKLAGSINSYQEVIRQLRNFFEASQIVTREEFRKFTSTTLKTYPGIQALEWIPIVPHSERASFEFGLRAANLPHDQILELRDGALRPSPSRERYYPVHFVEPLVGNEEVVGFDLSSDPARLAAIKRASTGRTTTATEPLVLVQETDSSLGYLVFAPAHRGNRLEGFVCGAFRVAEVVGTTPVSLASDGLEFSVRDLGLPPGKGILFGEPPFPEGGILSKKNIRVADRTWELAFLQPLSHLQTHQSWQSWALFTASVLITTVLAGFLLVFQGHTSRIERLVEQRTSDLDEARQEAMKLAEVKSAFLANMSHEIRTPLNGIVGMINLASDESLPPNVANMLQTAKHSADSLLVIINDILDFSKLEADRIRLDESPFCPAALADTIKTLFLPQAAEKNLELRTEFGVGLADWVLGDPNRIGQVLGNLTSNAIKFTESGGVVIAVRLVEREGEWRTSFEVRDTGIGLSPEDVDKLFVPFSQVDGSAAREFGGTGLGLAICRRLVKQMGGELSVESRKHHGSVFSFALALPECPPPPPREETPADSRNASPLRILLAEDSEVNQVVAQRYLNKLGYQAGLARNGREAVELANKTPYDLILMDMQMPVMDGLAATREIRKSFSSAQLRIVALTANVLNQHRNECRQAGMDDFLPKPIALDSLRRVIEEAIAWKRTPAPARTNSPEAAPG